MDQKEGDNEIKVRNGSGKRREGNKSKKGIRKKGITR
jgi:hypothetical protein